MREVKQVFQTTDGQTYDSIDIAEREYKKESTFMQLFKNFCLVILSIFTVGRSSMLWI